MIRSVRFLAGLTLATGLAAPAVAERVSVLVLDASGSMWNRVEGDLSRIEIARDVIGEYFATRDGAVPLSVIAYGHNRRGDCGDIEVVSPMGLGAPADLEARLRALMPRGMTPLTDSLALARGQIPAAAEAADIILVTDGLETCGGDPCALAAGLAAEGIEIRAHVVGFGLSREELQGLSCITEATGGMMFDTNSGAELTEALRQVSAAEPVPAMPEPEPEPAAEAAFDLGERAEAGFTYSIRWNGEAKNVDYIGFVPQGETRMVNAISYSTIGGTSTAPRNPVTRTAPAEPGIYDLVLVSARDGIIARQAVEVVPPNMGFEAIGSVEPGSRVRFVFRGPERVEERIVIARPGDPADAAIGDWGYALHKNGVINLTVPTEPGEYEVRYLNRGRTEILFSRSFGVGIPFDDADQTRAADLAAAAAAATQGDAGQDDIAAVSATFRLPSGLPDSPVSWDGIPLDPDMQPEAWAPMDTGHEISGLFEPGHWRITARAPGEVVFTADVAIFPGQENDFTLNVVDERLDGALAGGWILWAIPPREVADPPMEMAHIDLRLTDEGLDYIGRIAPQPGMGPDATPVDLNAVIIEHDTLLIDFAQPGIAAEPLRLALSPQGTGFVGTMTVAQHTMPVALWPEDAPLDPGLWSDAAFGPVADPEHDLSDIAFTCDQPRCEVMIDGLSATLEQGWSMTPPAWTSATAGAAPLDQPRVDFYGPDNAALLLNPHQWLASNGPCMTSAAGALCLWQDAPPHAMATAVPLAMSLRLVEREAVLSPGATPVQPADGPGNMAVEPDDGSYFAGYGPYQAGAEVLVHAVRQDRRPGDRIAVLAPGLTPVADTNARWLDDFRAGVQMPETPGTYTLALFDEGSSSLRAVTEIEVAAVSAPVFTRFNPNPRPGRSYSLSLQGRMVLEDRVAILTMPGDTVVEASLYDALRGDIRLPEGAFGAMQLVYRTSSGEILARETINVGGPPVLALSGGSDGPAEIAITGTLTPGGAVEVTLRGMIPAQGGVVGFIRAGQPDETILETGTRVSPDQTIVTVDVPDGDGPWVLRLVDQNLIRIAEIAPGAARPAIDLVPLTLPDGISAGDLMQILLPGFETE